jgi:hypothetical protein
MYQLTRVPKSVEEAYERQFTSGSFGAPSKATLITLLTDCFSQFSTVFIMVDAFDESGNGDRTKILGDLQELSHPQLRLFLTGRPHVFDHRDIREDKVLQRWLKTANFEKISASQTDVEKYLTDELEKRAKGVDQSIKDRILTTISSQAAGQ